MLRDLHTYIHVYLRLGMIKWRAVFQKVVEQQYYKDKRATEHRNDRMEDIFFCSKFQSYSLDRFSVEKN